ncbi:hypothetical protein L1987_33236 [Smallanthus sonchifolius]|uniref:Uncharacterized protein n=1 Tax=Smallanthus sonchifolius TaxID=185202 RepID=A0ACB9HRN7_9ASTR|nr:hypothetical protein L1987_33236 [Smallanthus sonchifolius]
MEDYQLWDVHGELYPDEAINVGYCSKSLPSQHMGQDVDEDLGEYTGYDQMVMEGFEEHDGKSKMEDYEVIEQIGREAFRHFHKHIGYSRVQPKLVPTVRVPAKSTFKCSIHSRISTHQNQASKKELSLWKEYNT